MWCWLYVCMLRNNYCNFSDSLTIAAACLVAAAPCCVGGHIIGVKEVEIQVSTLLREQDRPC